MKHAFLRMAQHVQNCTILCVQFSLGYNKEWLQETHKARKQTPYLYILTVLKCILDFIMPVLNLPGIEFAHPQASK